MIFKTLLKYKIFEWCLDTLFDKINNNFNDSPNIKDYYTGIDILVIDEYGNKNKVLTFYYCNIIYNFDKFIQFDYEKYLSYPDYSMHEYPGIAAYNKDEIYLFK